MSETRSITGPSREPVANKANGLRALAARAEWVCVLLAVVTIAVYWPVRHFDFVNYDDPAYVTSNMHVRRGLTLSGLGWAFGTSQTANWHPVTWLSHMLDVELFGLNPAGHHLVNVLLHSANSVLLFIVLLRLTGARWRSAFVAALFALHPLHVESVAWISERKDVLSTLFWLLTLWAYAGYATKAEGRMKIAEGRSEDGRDALPRVQADRQVGPTKVEPAEQVDHTGGQDTPRGVPTTTKLRCPRAGWYWLGLLLFALGLMAKPMLVTLPFVLLLLDYWPLGRFESLEFQSLRLQKSKPEAPVNDSSTLNSKLSNCLRLVREKIPFFILSGIFCAVTFLVQQQNGAVVALTKISLRMRIENTFISYVRYLGKLFWPVDLAVAYPYPADWPAGWVILSVVLTVGLCAAGWWIGRRWRYVRTGWFWFFGTLIPVIGIVQVGNQSIADRYAYVPSIGIFILVSWGVWTLFELWAAGEKGSTGAPDKTLQTSPLLSSAGGERAGAWMLAVGGILILGACAVQTRSQLAYWYDSETLFRHTIAVTRNNGLAYDSLASRLFDKGQLVEAVESYRVALRIHPHDPMAQEGLGCCFFNEGRIDEAILYFRQSLAAGTNQASSLFNLGSALAQKQQYGEAISYFDAARRLEADDPDIPLSLGNVYLRQKRYQDAIDCYTAALRLAPDDANAHKCLGAVLFQLGRLEEAGYHYQETLRLVHDDVDAHLMLAQILARMGQRSEAIIHLSEVLRLKPGDETAQRLLHELQR